MLKVVLSVILGFLITSIVAHGQGSESIVTGGGGTGIPGMTGGVAGDDTLAYIYNLESFQDLPSYPRFYFSESGSDANPCTEQFPCLTVDKMEAIANLGLVHIILDSAGDWDAATDWTAGGGNEEITITNPPGCNGIGPNAPCVIFSASSFSPQDRAELLCTSGPNATTNGGLFVINFDSATYGWFAIQNIQTNDCPDDLSYKQSNFVLLAAGAKMVALNFKNVTGTKGSDVATTGENAVVRGVGANTEAVFLNAEAFVSNAGTSYASDLFWGGDGSLMLIGRSQLYNLDSDGTNVMLARTGAQTSGVNQELVVIGHTLSSSINLGNIFGLNGTYGTSSGVSIFTADTTFIGFVGSNNAAIYSQYLGGTDGPWLSPVTMFRSTFSGTMTAMLRTVTNGAATAALTGRCLLAEDFATGDNYWRMALSVGRTDLAGMPIVLEGLYDDDAAGDRYNINLIPYATAALANAALEEVPGTALSLWEGASIENGGAGVDGDPFGVLASQHACNSADCFARCTADKTASYTFLNSGIPAFVLGERVVGLSLGGTISNFGGR